MSFVIVYQCDTRCHIVQKEEEIISALEDEDWSLDDVTIYEINDPIEYSLKLVRKQTLVRKEK